MAAASAARTLADAGARVAVVDKARGAGGRCATRRGEHAAYDHGAQYFTVRDARFLAALQASPLIEFSAAWDVLVGVWDGAGIAPANPQSRQVGVPGMSSMVRAMLADLPALYGTPVAHLTRASGGWQLLDQQGRARVAAKAVILTAPPPQCLALLGDSAPSLSRLCASVHMEPCWAVMAAFRERVNCEYDGVFVNRGALSWCARNGSKPGRTGTETWVLHAGPAWSSECIDEAPETVGAALMAHFTEVVGCALPALRELHVHRWRHALARTPLQVGCAWDDQARLGLAGDWMAGSRIEGAWLSGNQVARRALSAMGFRGTRSQRRAHLARR